MIELIHKYPVLIKLLLTLVTVAFVFTGGYMFSREDTGSYAAKVGEAKIGMQEYQDALTRMEEFYNKIYQGNIPPDMMKKLGLEKKALDALVDREILLQEANKQGILVSDDELSDAVHENKSFLGEDGRFSKARYTEILKANGMTPVVYERELKNELTVDKFKKMVKDAVYLSENEVRDAYKKQLAAQKKEFKEEEFQAQKENLWRIQTLLAQEKLMSSFMDGLRKNYEIEINPSLKTAA
jgi:peptidyl-prolyl cis-trans isomerase D